MPTRNVEPRIVVDKIVQFRQPDEAEWHAGRTRNLSRSGLLFSSFAYLSIGSVVELCLMDMDGKISLPRAGERCVGQVVRRVLMSWPEVVPVFAVRFLEGGPIEREWVA